MMKRHVQEGTGKFVRSQIPAVKWLSTNCCRTLLIIVALHERDAIAEGEKESVEIVRFIVRDNELERCSHQTPDPVSHPKQDPKELGGNEECWSLGQLGEEQESIWTITQTKQSEDGFGLLDQNSCIGDDLKYFTQKWNDDIGNFPGCGKSFRLGSFSFRRKRTSFFSETQFKKNLSGISRGGASCMLCPPLD